MWIGLLGPIHVVADDGTDVAVRAPKERALLAVLALRTGTPVGTGELIAALWGSDPPASAGKLVQTYVSALRRVLANGAIETTAGGYQLCLSPRDIDVTEFEQLIGDGCSAAGHGDFQRALTLLQAALRRWRGEPIVDLADHLIGMAESARLEELRHRAEESLADARLALGDHAAIIGDLEAAVAAEPLRERRWAQLMVALYRSGRQADALRAYQRLRSRLNEELGINPSGELAALEEAMLLQRPELLAGHERGPAESLPLSEQALSRAPTESQYLEAPQSRDGTPELSEHLAGRGPATASGVTLGSSGQTPWDWGAVDAGVVLPARLVVAARFGFVGRAIERERLDAAVKAVIAGENSGLVLVSGEAGVGKTTLAAEFGRAAHARGVTVLYGRCDQDVGMPYGPFVEVMSHYVANAPDTWLALHAPRRMSELVRLVPGVVERLPDLPVPVATDADAERYLLFRAVADLFRAAATSAPLIIIFDDLHWADRPTLKLLCYLAAQPLGRVLMVGTYRDAELTALHPLTDALATLRRESAVERLSLGGLSYGEVAAYLIAAVGSDLVEERSELVHALYKETDGNPFFVAEMVRHLSETGILAASPDAVSINSGLVAAGLPDSVREVVSARLGRLGDQAAFVVSTASVIGQDFDLDLLARSTGLDEDVLVNVLGLAEQSTLVSEVPRISGRFRFAHGLIRRTVYDELGAARKCRLHARVAAALEEQCGVDPGPRIGELAHHCLAAVTGAANVPKAVTNATQAAEMALSILAPDEAVRWYSQALEVLAGAPDERERARCLVGLGDAQRQAGDPAFTATLLEAARLAKVVGEPELLVRAALANNRGFESSSGEVDADRVSVLEAALDTTHDDAPERARLLATLAMELTYDPDLARRVSLAEEAVAVANRSKDDAAKLEALVRPYPALMVPELADRRLQRVVDAVELSDAAKDPVTRFWMLVWFGHAMVERADIDSAQLAYAEVDRIAAEIGQPSLLWASRWASSWRALLAGNPDTAERLATEAFQIGDDSGQPDAFVIYGLQLLCVRWHQGRISEILPALGDLAAEYEHLPAWQAALAFGEALEGDPSRARDLLHVAEASQFELPDDRVRLIGTCAWAEAVSELAEPSAAAALYERLASWHGHVPISGHAVFHSVAHSLGQLASVLERGDEAEAHFAEALSIHRRLRAPFFVAETELAWGLRLTGSRRHRSIALLQDALALADRYGYTRLQRIANAALKAKKAQPSRRG